MFIDSGVRRRPVAHQAIDSSRTFFDHDGRDIQPGLLAKAWQRQVLPDAAADGIRAQFQITLWRNHCHAAQLLATLLSEWQQHLSR